MTASSTGLPVDLKDCIVSCWETRTQCQKMLYEYCLEKGGLHASTDHVKIMTDCMEICQTAADFMSRNSEAYASVCAACAEVCHKCADSCEETRDQVMLDCALLCRKCAEMCDDISLSSPVDSSGLSIESNITLI